MHFFIEGSNSKNHGVWPKGWNDHVGLSQMKLSELMEIKNVSQLGFLAPRTNPTCVPKRLPEASFVSPQEEDHDPD